MYRRYKKMNTEELLIGGVIQRLLGHLWSRAQHTSPGMAEMKSSWITCTEQSCEAFGSSCQFLVGPSLSRHHRSSLNPLGLTELQKPGPLLGSRWMLVTADLFSTTELPLLLVNSKTYPTEVPWVEGEVGDSSCCWSGGGITPASNIRDSAWMFLGCNVTKRAAAVGMLWESQLSCIFRYNKVITYSCRCVFFLIWKFK